MMTHLESAPLPAIRDEPEERRWLDHLEDLLREANTLAEREKARIVLRGGTAAKIGHGLTRPSRDIDIDLVGRADPWTLLERGATNASMIATATIERTRRQKGRLQIHEPATGSTVIEVDVRTIRDPDRTTQIMNGAIAERRHGIWMYRAEELARQKIEMATEPRRRRAKDRYDIAWWLRTRPESIAASDRIALDRALRTDDELRIRWDESHARDPVLRHIESTKVHDALIHALDCDPIVLHERDPHGKLHVDLHPQGGATLKWTSTLGDPTERTIAEFDSDQELENFMMTMGLWSPKEIPGMFEQFAKARIEPHHIGRSTATATHHPVRSHPTEPEEATMAPRYVVRTIDED